MSILYRNKLKAVLESTLKFNLLGKNVNRSISMSRFRLEKAAQELQKNPFYEKYAQKIAILQETNPDEFLQRIEEKEKKLKEMKERRAKERKFQETQAKPAFESLQQNKSLKLNDIMKMDLIKDMNAEELTKIWTEYHKGKDCIAAVMTKEQFNKMFERGKKYSTFLLPLPRETGYEFIVSQFYGTEIHMTSLLWYQAHKENAPECLSMMHFTELSDTTGLVLMRGEFDTKSLNAQEAQCLANELQLYYSSDDPARLELLKKFTEKPDEFKHMDLISQLETISLETNDKNEKLKKKN